jgi:hypothetical protein
MSIAHTWVEYTNSAPFSLSEKDLPLLDFGILQPVTWSTKRVIGLRWLGGSVQNVKFWMEGSLADIYRDSLLPEPELRVDLNARGYKFRYTLLEQTGAIVLATCKAATNGNISGYSAGEFPTAPDNYDGVTLNVGDRLLVKDQATKLQNGIYSVAEATLGAINMLSRSSDCQAIYRGGVVNVSAGTAGANKSYFMYAPSGTNAIGSLDITWVDRTTRTTHTNCQVATTGNINLSAAPAVIDGRTLQLNDRVLVRAQSNKAQNGIYSVTSLYPANSKTFTAFSQFSGQGMTALNAGERVSAMVAAGTAGRGKIYNCRPTTSAPYSVGSTSFQWVDATHYYGTTTVRIHTTANIANLNGGAPLVVNGVTLVNGNRVLVAAQTDTSKNGIYSVTSAGTGGDGVWDRASDFNTTAEIVPTIVTMSESTNTYGHNWFHMFPDTQYQENFVLDVSGIQVVGNITYTRGFYLPCSNMVNSNISNFSSVATSAFVTAAPAVGQRVLVRGQTAGAENGIYTITGTAGPNWVLARADDLNASGDIKAFANVFVENGSFNALFWLDLPPGPYALGTTVLRFVEAPTAGTIFTVQAAGTSNVATLVGGAPDVIDGVTLVGGSIYPVLLLGQSTLSQNILYSVANPPSAPVLTRDPAFLIEPAQVTTLTGQSLGSNQLWETYYNPATTVINTDAVEFIKVSSRTNFTATATSSTANVDLTLAAPGSIDGVTLAVNSRVLLKNQTDKKENGIYIVTPQRTLRLVRASDMNEDADMNPAVRTQVLQGVLWSNTWWGIYLDNPSPVMGTNNIRWVKQPAKVRLEPARVATMANIANLSSGTPKTVDGISLQNGDRVLVKNQSTQSQNGVYRVASAGTGSNGSWVRASDLSTDEQLVPQLAVYIEEGTANGQDDYIISLPTPLDTPPAYDLGTTNIQWTLQSALTIFNQSPDTWNAIPYSLDQAVPLGAATLGVNNEAYSVKFAVAAQPPTGEADGEVRRMRFMAQYETVDE